MEVKTAREGYVPFRGYQTFYRLVGDIEHTPPGRYPLLALHGRPPSHEALEDLEKLAVTGRPVILYDQLGCGHSDRPDDPSLWTIDLFVEEVAAVRHHLELERVHLLGHSWGGMLAQEVALNKPSGVVSLVLASTFCDRAQFAADVEALRQALPVDVYATLQAHEATGTTDDPAYRQAVRVFDLRHICRIDPWPECFQRAMQHEPVGRVDTERWSVRRRLGEIDLPTLVTCGRYDIATPNMAEMLHAGIPGSRLVVFEDSSHYPHIEENQRYLAVLDEFLSGVEHRAGLT